jgi:polyhydroxybutyrate depolymerase
LYSFWVMLKTIWFALLSTILTIGASNADSAQTIVVEGINRTFLIHIPANSPTHPPLVIVFHGSGGTGATIAANTGMDNLADRLGFIVVYPNGRNRQWQDGRTSRADGTDDLAFTTAIIKAVEQSIRVDPTRIYAAGFSNGATFTESLVCRLPGQFAAVAAVSGTIPQRIMSTCSHAVSVMQIGGTGDAAMPYDGGQVMGGGKPSGAVSSFNQTVDFWASIDGCSGVSSPITVDGTGQVDMTKAIGCEPGFDVTAYTIQGGQHAWPGGTGKMAFAGLDASEIIAEFLLAHKLRE